MKRVMWASGISIVVFVFILLFFTDIFQLGIFSQQESNNRNTNSDEENQIGKNANKKEFGVPTLTIYFENDAEEPIGADDEGISPQKAGEWHYQLDGGIALILNPSTSKTLYFISERFYPAELEYGISKNRVIGKVRTKKNSNWSSFNVEIGEAITVSLNRYSVLLKGIAIGTRLYVFKPHGSPYKPEPIETGTVVAREVGEENIFQKAELEKDGLFSLKWFKGIEEVQLSIQSDKFPQTNWITVQIPSKVTLEKNQDTEELIKVIDLGEVNFGDILGNCIWGYVTGNKPRDLHLALQYFFGFEQGERQFFFVCHEKNYRGHRLNREGKLKNKNNLLTYEGDFKKYEFCPVGRHFFNIVLSWGREKDSKVVMCTEKIHIPLSAVVRRDFNFEKGYSVSGEIHLPWDSKKKPQFYHPKDPYPTAVLFPSRTATKVGEGKPIGCRLISLSGEKKIELFQYLNNTDENGVCPFTFTYVPKGRYRLEIIFYANRINGKDVPYWCELEVPSKNRFKIDLSHLRPVKVNIHDALWDQKNPLFDSWHEGLAKRIIDDCCKYVVYTIESPDEDVNNRFICVTAKILSEPLSSIPKRANRRRVIENQLNNGVWAVLYLPQEPRSITVSRLINFRYWNTAVSTDGFLAFPEECARRIVRVGIDDAEIHMNLARPKQLSLPDGNSLPLNKTEGTETRIYNSSDGKTFEITYSASGIEKHTIVDIENKEK